MEAQTWIMRPLNPLFLAVSAAFLLLLALASLALRGRCENTRRWVLVSACTVTFAGFFAYKYCLSVDAAYAVITARTGGFDWWAELPMHLCNVNMILIPIAVLRRSRPLMCFGFFLGPLGALMALLMPSNGFDGYSLLLPRMLGYYGTHFMIVIEGLALVTFGFFRPRFSDLPRTILTALLICFGAFCVSALLRAAGLSATANYFYSLETEGNFLLEMFRRWIPLPFLYLMPCVAILGVYMAVVTAGFALADRLRGRNAPAG